MIQRSLRLLAIGLFLGLGWRTLACMDGPIQSVHFYQSTFADSPAIDFGRLPQEVMSPTWNNEYIRSGTIYGHANWDEEMQIRNHIRYLSLRARNFEQAKQYDRALNCYRLLPNLRVESFDLGTGESNSFVWAQTGFRSFVRDRQEVLSLKRSSNLQEYLKARAQLEFGNNPKARKALWAMRTDPVLGEYAWYASLSKNDVDGFIELADKFPKGRRTPDALIMAARSLLRSDKATPNACDKAEALLTKLQRTFPESRYIVNSQGWLGRVSFLRGNYDGALKCYYRQLAISRNSVDKWSAYDSIALINSKQGLRARVAVCRLRQWALPLPRLNRVWSGWGARQIFDKLNSKEASMVQKAIRSDSALLTAYLGFRLEDTSLNRAQERNLLKFATASLEHMPSASADLLARVAQLNYNNGDYWSAERLGKRASNASKRDLAWARGTYVVAASSARLGKNRSAIRAYRKVVTHAPKFLQTSALEALAQLYEYEGDSVNALTCYYKLDFDLDIAYIADVKMSALDLSKFIATLPRSKRPPFQYTLAMRFMRVGEYQKAKTALLAIPRTLRNHYGLTKNDVERLGPWWPEPFSPTLDSVRVANDLMGKDRQFQSARGSNAKAQALYEKGAYIYKRRNLLFYSLALWQGSRSTALGIFWNPKTNRPEDERARVRHSYEHECLAQAMKLFQRVINEYPHSRVMPKALYTAAVASDRLGNLNEWWRRSWATLEGQSVKWLKRIVAEYPNDPLAKPAAKFESVFSEQLVSWKKGGPD